jgi:hypothetical protein
VAENHESRPAGNGTATSVVGGAEPSVARAIPTAPLIGVVANKYTRIVTVGGPYCAGHHVHGWPHGQTRVGSRVADCGGGTYLVGEVVA